MPRITVETSHALDVDEAMRRLKDKLAAAKDTYRGQFSDFREEWNGHTFSYAFRAAGMKFSGTAALDGSRVRLDADVPLAVMMFKGMIQARIADELSVLLA